MKKTLLTLIFLAGAFLASAQPRLKSNNIDEILQEMTPEEKVQLVVGAGKKTTRQGVPTGAIELIKDAAGMTRRSIGSGLRLPWWRMAPQVFVSLLRGKIPTKPSIARVFRWESCWPVPGTPNSWKR